MNEYERKADLFNYISDAHKDAYGFRPRGYDWENMEVAELEAWADRLSDAVVEAIAEEEAAHERARIEWNAAIGAAIAAGAGDRETAIRWLLEAEELDEYDFWYGSDYINFTFGVGYRYNLLTGAEEYPGKDEYAKFLEAA